MRPRVRLIAGLILIVLLAPPAGDALASPTITEYVVPTHGRQPLGITAGPDGNLWFTESVAPGAIGRSTTSGVITEFTAGLSGAAQGITAGPDGNLWFTEQGADKIGKITPSGTITEFSLTAKSEPIDIAAGPDGNLWFTEMGSTAKIGRITTSGTVTEFTTGLTSNSEPTGITAGPDGNMWFAESHNPGRIGRITTGGTITEFSSGLTKDGQPERIAPGADGNLWFTESSANKLGKITPTGTITEFSSGLTLPAGLRGIAAGGDGNVYFAESSNPGAIGMITPAGAISELATPTTFSQPQLVTKGPDGNEWFTESGGFGRIAVITVAPSVATTAPSAVGELKATLNADVGANSQATTYRFEYGTTVSYGTQTSSTSAGSGAAPAPVSATVNGLTAGTVYHYRVVATNATETSYGSDQTFTTATAPSANTTPATAVTLTGATLNGAVNPKGQPTTYHFEWGPTSAFGTNTPSVDAAVGSDSSEHPLAQTLSGLSSSQTYHYRIVASNCGGCPEGTSYGAEQTFTTAAPPAAATLGAEAVGLTSATVTGEVNPSGSETTYHFDWGQTSAYGSQTPATDATVGSDSAWHATSQAITGLAAGTLYHYRVVATNCSGCPAGTSYGVDQTFTTVPAPSALTALAADIGLTTATLVGEVNPRATATTYHFDWGETSAYGLRAPLTEEPVGSDDVWHALSQSLAGLAPGTTYHYRVVATNCSGCPAGTSYGADQTAVTSAPAIQSQPTTTAASTMPSGLGGGPHRSGLPPQLGHTALAHPLSGTVLVRMPHSATLQPLSASQNIPVGSQIDTTHGRVLLSTATDRSGHTQTATLWGGTFVIGQSSSNHGMTTFTLAGAHLRGCAARGRRTASASARRHPTRALWAQDHGGRFSTRGQNSVATVRGTVWATVERCDGTLTIVRSGVVSVRSNRTHRGVLVTAGHRFLAAP